MLCPHHSNEQQHTPSQGKQKGPLRQGDTVLALTCPSTVVDVPAGTAVAPTDLYASVNTNGVDRTYKLPAGFYKWDSLLTVSGGDICFIGQGASPDNVVITYNTNSLNSALYLDKSKLGVKVCECCGLNGWQPSPLCSNVYSWKARSTVACTYMTVQAVPE